MSHKESSKRASQSDASSQDEARGADSLEDAAAAESGKCVADDPGINVESVADDLAANLGNLQAELEEAQDRALRSSAELENFRRRVNRQMEDERRYANMDLLRELLPIWDNMRRAVDAAKKAGEADSLIEGFKMVCAQLETVFERFHCVKIEADGQPFDPHLHEAISQMPSADHPAGNVLFVTQVGFLLHDRVVRPCQVVVSTSPPNAERPELSSVDGTTEESAAGDDVSNEGHE